MVSMISLTWEALSVPLAATSQVPPQKKLWGLGQTAQSWAAAVSFTLGAIHTPGMLVYRRSIAKAVLGTDDPETVGAAVADWDNGVRAHVLVPLVVPLARHVVADAALNVLHGAVHPVHHVGVHHHGLVVLHPGGGDVVGIHPGGVRPAGVHVIAGGLHLLRRLVKLIPVGHGGAYGLRVVGAQDGLGGVQASDGGKVLNIYVWNEEFQGKFNENYPQVEQLSDDKSIAYLKDVCIY